MVLVSRDVVGWVVRGEVLELDSRRRRPVGRPLGGCGGVAGNGCEDNGCPGVAEEGSPAAKEKRGSVTGETKKVRHSARSRRRDPSGVTRAD